jgi:DNA-directed RNA polymerase specialized sigma24 family protein
VTPQIDPEAAEWVSNNYGLIIVTARSVFPTDDEAAEESAQEAALRIMLKWGLMHYDQDTKRNAWAVTVTKRVALDLMRKMRRRQAREQRLPEERAAALVRIAVGRTTAAQRAWTFARRQVRA